MTESSSPLRALASRLRTSPWLLLAAAGGLLILTFGVVRVSGDAADPPAPGPVIVEVAIASPDDDVEEASDGSLSRDSTDLELVTEESIQVVGLRFESLDVPVGSRIESAWVQFTADESSRGRVDLEVRAGAMDDAGLFLEDRAVSDMQATGSFVAWEPPPWRLEGQATVAQRTPDLSGVIQEVIDRPGWDAGNALTILVSGSGTRVAVSYDGSPDGAPLLHVAYTPGNGPVAVTSTSTPDGSTTLPAEETTAPVATTTTTTTTTPPPNPIRFAVIGDFGNDHPDQWLAADMIEGWGAEFVVTAGDNTYGDTTRDETIGQFYSRFIGSYDGDYGGGSDVNRFFPSLGNHDYTDDGGLGSYLDYFALPGDGIETSDTSGNERYYDFRWDFMHFFVLNSNEEEPDGITADSVQGKWLRDQMAASDAIWRIVVLHHAPYSSDAVNGSTEVSRWPYREWGADLILTGHAHTYERFLVDDLAYVISGLAVSHYDFEPERTAGSEFSYSEADIGVLLIEACEDGIHLEYETDALGVIDEFDVGAGCGG